MDEGSVMLRRDDGIYYPFYIDIPFYRRGKWCLKGKMTKEDFRTLVNTQTGVLKSFSRVLI